MDNAVEYPKFRFMVGIAAAVGWINIGWIIVGFAPLLQDISNEFQVPWGTVLIAVMSMNAVAGGTSALICGPLIDRFGPRKCLFVSALLCVGYAALIPWFSNSLSEVVLLRMLAGFIAHGPIFAGKAALAQRWFPRKEQGTWIGIWNATFAVGTFLLYQVAFVPIMTFAAGLEDAPVKWLPHITPEGAWRVFGASSILPSLVMAILVGISLLGKEPEVARHRGKIDVVKKDFNIALGVAAFWAGAILLGCAQGIMQTINGVTANYLFKNPAGLNWAPQTAGPLVGSVQIGMIVSGFLMGAILKYIFRGKIKWLSASAFLLSGVTAYGLVSVYAKGSTGHMRVALLAAGFMMNIGYPAVTTFITANFPPHILGKVFGICGGISVYMGALFSGIAGALLDTTQTFNSVYGFLFVIGVIACIVSLIFLNPVKAYAERLQQGGSASSHCASMVPVAEAAPAHAD